MKVYGPYVYPSGTCEGRRYVILRDGSSSRQILYSRFLMEEHLGRQLGPEEQVDHIDEDFTNDRLDNLQILTPGENARKHNLGKRSVQRGVERGWTHGTTYGWMKKKCTCVPCVTAKRAWNDRRNEQRRQAFVA